MSNRTIFPRPMHKDIVEVQGKRYRIIWWNGLREYEFEAVDGGNLHGRYFSEERVSKGIKKKVIIIIQ
jgi:hypothetical protein